jgi:hypothetical protein
MSRRVPSAGVPSAGAALSRRASVLVPSGAVTRTSVPSKVSPRSATSSS